MSGQAARHIDPMVELIPLGTPERGEERGEERGALDVLRHSRSVKPAHNTIVGMAEPMNVSIEMIWVKAGLRILIAASNTLISPGRLPPSTIGTLMMTSAPRLIRNMGTNGLSLDVIATRIDLIWRYATLTFQI